MTGIVQDHYLLAWALSIGGARWEPWCPSFFGPARFKEPYGDFRFDGTVFLTKLGPMGVPLVTSALREAILDRIEAWRMEPGPEYA